MTPSVRTQGLGILGLGAAACAVCCAGPVLAFLGGLTLAGAAATFLIGALGLVVVAIAGLAWLFVRRRRSSCQIREEPVPVAAPARRSSA
jgi:hypothetical protein